MYERHTLELRVHVLWKQRELPSCFNRGRHARGGP